MVTSSRAPAQYDFDTVVDRRRTNSVKWDFCNCCAGVEDLLPMWVADMDFLAPPEVVDRVREVADHGIYGYSEMPESYYEAIIDWAGRRYGVELTPERITYTPGVITGLNIAIQRFTIPGDSVIIQPPVYPPFYAAVRNNGRKVIENRLIDDGHRFSMDLEGLEAAIEPRTRMIVLCSPHNPVGRVWSAEELEGVARIAERHDLIVFSDEIHADIVYGDRSHLPFASLSPEVAQRTITGFAPSKTFNIAGLKASVITSENASFMGEFEQMQINTFGLYNANIFAIAALEASYRYGEAWLEALLAYLEENAEEATRLIQGEIPGVRAYRPEGTFLLWLDFRELGLDQEQLRQLVFCNAKVGLNDGPSFGSVGQGYMRMNFGCPRSLLREGLSRLKEAIA